MNALTIDGVSAIAVILIASFAIDRIVTGILFMLSFFKPWTRHFPDPKSITNLTERIAAEKKQKFIYFALAGILSIGVLAGYGGIRIFKVVAFPGINPVLDAIATGVILVAGSERIASLINLGEASGTGESAPASQPIEITGKLTIEGEAEKQLTSK